MASTAQKVDLSKWKFPLVPKKGMIRKSDRDRAYDIHPLDKLPSFLLPSKSPNAKRQPPTLHLGWLVDDTVLIRLAKERGIRPASSEPQKSPKSEGEDSKDEESDHAEYRLDGTHKKIAFVTRCRELELRTMPGLCLVYDAPNKGTAYAVSLMSNYEGAIGRRDWDKLVEEFKFEGPPKWFLDYVDWHWK